MRMLAAIILIVSCIVNAGPKSDLPLHHKPYIWIKIKKIETKSGGLVNKIYGEVITKEKDIANINSLSKKIIVIQWRPDGKWYLPPQVFYKYGELKREVIYKAVYDGIKKPPKGFIEIIPFGM